MKKKKIRRIEQMTSIAFIIIANIYFYFFSIFPSFDSLEELSYHKILIGTEKNNNDFETLKHV